MASRTRSPPKCAHLTAGADHVTLLQPVGTEAVFAGPYTFDIIRSPNPHLGSGGPGPYPCLGAHLARGAITVMLRGLLTWVPGIHATAELVR